MHEGHCAVDGIARLPASGGLWTDLLARVGRTGPSTEQPTSTPAGTRAGGGRGDDDQLEDLLAGPAPTLLPDARRPRAAATRACRRAEVAAAHPESSLAVGEPRRRGVRRGAVVESYAYARIGYHRGLDPLRRSGWKGHGPVPWEHEPNRGFLRCLHALGRAAARDRRDRRGRSAASDLPARQLPAAAAALGDCAGRLGPTRALGAAAQRPAATGEETPCPRSCSSAPSGATRARARRPTCSATAVDYVVQVQRRQQRRAHHRRSTARSTPLHLLPSRHPHPRRASPVIGNGVVIDLGVLFGEIDALEARGVDTSRLRRQRQRARDRRRTTARSTRSPSASSASRKIGTTGRGIGPTYADKMNRVGIRVQDLFDEKILRQKVEGALELKNQLLVKVYNRRAIDRRRGRRGAARRTPTGCGRWSPTPRCCSTRRSTTARPCCSRAARPRCSTSTTAPTRSSPRRTPTAGGACTGSRHPADPHRPGHRDRQGLHDPRRRGPVPDRAARRGRRAAAQRSAREFGTTTGRPRRCGWYDAVDRALRRAGQRRHRLRAHQARRAHRLGADPGLRGVRRRRRAASTRCR